MGGAPFDRLDQVAFPETLVREEAVLVEHGDGKEPADRTGPDPATDDWFDAPVEEQAGNHGAVAIPVFAIGDVRRKSFGGEDGWSDKRVAGRYTGIDESDDRRGRARGVYRGQVIEIQGEELWRGQCRTGQDVEPGDHVQLGQLPDTAGRRVHPGQDDAGLVARVSVGYPPSGCGDGVAEEVGPLVSQ